MFRVDIPKAHKDIVLVLLANSGMIKSWGWRNFFLTLASFLLHLISYKSLNLGSGYIYGPVTKDFFAIFTAFLSAHVQASHDLVCYYFKKKT